MIDTETGLIRRDCFLSHWPICCLALIGCLAWSGIAQAQPNATWTIQGTVTDYSVSNYSATNPARGQYSYSVSGTTVQSYVVNFFPRGISCPPLVCATRDSLSESGDV